MKEPLRAVFAPLLNVFERGEEPFVYRPSHRTILKVVGVLFLSLACALVGVGVVAGQPGVAIPGVVFFCVGLTALVVGFLGTDRAVSKIWGNR